MLEFNKKQKKIIGIVSPPYSKAEDGGGIFKQGYRGKHIDKMGKNQPDKIGERTYSKSYHNFSKKNIGNLPDKEKIVAITSPPYENSISSEKHGIDRTKFKSIKDEGGKNSQINIPLSYSKDKSNIGTLKDNLAKDGVKSIEDFDIIKYHSCLGDLYWYGCYDSEVLYKQFVTQESFAHPAKASFLLIERIFKHLEKLELLTEDMTVCDFMAGSSRIPLLASLRGYNSIAVELEPHFIKMSEDNKKHCENKIGRKLNMEIIQGDSRQLSKLLNKADIGLVSPPFADMSKPERKLDDVRLKNNRFRIADSYSRKEMVGVVSPPYDDRLRNENREFSGGILQREYEKGNTKFVESYRYSKNKENIGNQINESYLSAMLQVYKEASKVCPIIVTITKNPTRQGKLRRLDLDTAKLLEMSGYKILDYHRSILFKENTQKTLTGEVKKEYKGRLSFFKRLSLAKGNVASMWEDIIIAKRI